MTTTNVVRKRSNRVQSGLRFQFDYWLLLAIGGLLVIGMLTVYSTTFDIGMRWQDDANYYIRRQFIALLIGLAGFFVVMQCDYLILRMRYLSVLMLLGTLALLIAILFFGESSLGAVRGLQGGSYQPSEIAKLTMILYIAHWLSTKGDRIKSATYGLIPFSIITAVVCALVVLEPDLSTAALIALISFTVFFVAGADWRQFAAVGVLGGATFLLLIFALPHSAARWDAFVSSFSDPVNASYQMGHTLAALARGGITGVGLGASSQKYVLPAAHTDGAFAIWAEEAGLLGGLLVIGLLAMLAWRGLRAASRARDTYGALLAIGITCWLSYQALLNMAVITAVIPFTGIPLPFISYGGSSLAVSLVGAGILLNVSRDAAVTQRVQPQKAGRGQA